MLHINKNMKQVVNTSKATTKKVHKLLVDASPSKPHHETTNDLANLAMVTQSKVGSLLYVFYLTGGPAACYLSVPHI